MADGFSRVRRGYTNDLHFCCARGGNADVGIFEHHAPLRRNAKPLGTQQKNFGVGLTVRHVGCGNNFLEIPAQADQFGHQLNILTGRGRTNDARNAGRVQTFQKFFDARQGVDTGLADDLPVKLFLLPREPLDFRRVSGPAEELRDDAFVFHPETGLKVARGQR